MDVSGNVFPGCLVFRWSFLLSPLKTSTLKDAKSLTWLKGKEKSQVKQMFLRRSTKWIDLVNTALYSILNDSFIKTHVCINVKLRKYLCFSNLSWISLLTGIYSKVLACLMTLFRGCGVGNWALVQSCSSAGQSFPHHRQNRRRYMVIFYLCLICCEWFMIVFISGNRSP